MRDAGFGEHLLVVDNDPVAAQLRYGIQAAVVLGRSLEASQPFRTVFELALLGGQVGQAAGGGELGHVGVANLHHVRRGAAGQRGDELGADAAPLLDLDVHGPTRVLRGEGGVYGIDHGWDAVPCHQPDSQGVARGRSRSGRQGPSAYPRYDGESKGGGSNESFLHYALLVAEAPGHPGGLRVTFVFWSRPIWSRPRIFAESHLDFQSPRAPRPEGDFHRLV